MLKLNHIRYKHSQSPHSSKHLNMAWSNCEVCLMCAAEEQRILFDVITRSLRIFVQHKKINYTHTHIIISMLKTKCVNISKDKWYFLWCCNPLLFAEEMSESHILYFWTMMVCTRTKKANVLLPCGFFFLKKTHFVVDKRSFKT